MKVQGENILVSGLEMDELAMDSVGSKLDEYLSDTLSTDVEYYQDEIDYSLDICLEDYYEVPGDYIGVNVPQDRKNFRLFRRNGKRLLAGEAASLLGYLDADSASERAKSNYRVSRTFAEEIAILSIYRAAKHTEEADDVRRIPVRNLSVYREVQAMPSTNHARIVWARSFNDGSSRDLREAYYNEFKRKREEEAAGNSIGNAYEIADAYGFSLSDAVKAHLDRQREA